MRPAALAAALSAALAGAQPFERYGCLPGHDQYYPFCDTSLTIAQRVDDLISRLTLEEKPQLMEARYSPLGNISRLGVPQYDWGANCVHGVQSRCGVGSKNDTRCPTPFPNPNFLGATFNESLWKTMGRVIGLELRSLWKQGAAENHNTPLPPVGLDCWSPNVNLVRDPRWGRNLETASEDPYLLGRFGVAVTDGLQNGDDPKYLQAVATLKHFVANSLDGSWPGPGGPASYPGTGLCPGGTCTRMTIDPNISIYDLASSYFPAFQASVVEGGALGVMCSYNSVNGVPSCANKWLLQEKLRGDWGFQGYVTGDSGAIANIYKTHFYVPSIDDAVAAAVAAGADIQSGNWPAGQPWSVHGEYIDLIPKLVAAGKISEEALDDALRHSLTLRFRLGLFDPPADQPYEHISPDAVRSPEHVAAAVDASEQGLVLLQNKVGPDGKRALPLPSAGKKIALLGPHATLRLELLGNYLGETCPERTPSGDADYGCVETFLEAMQDLCKDTVYAPGLSGVVSTDLSLIPEAVATAQGADAVVLFLGLDTISVEKEGQDRHDTGLPAGQLALFDAVQKTGRPVTVVLVNGGAVSMREVRDGAAAIVEAWYPGFFGARAVARALLGLSNRWGKLPVTIYDETFIQQVDMLDFDMSKAPGRTYRYYTGTPLWPFGFGLSYTNFTLTLLSAPAAELHKGGCQQFPVRVELRNTGAMVGDEVAMMYFRALPGTIPPGTMAERLREQLFGFRRVAAVAPGDAGVAEWVVNAAMLSVYADSGDKVIYPGTYEVRVSNGLDSVTVQVKVDAQGSAPTVLERWSRPAAADAGRRPDSSIVV